MNPHFELDGRTIGAGPPFVVAEIGQAHEGSLGMAHAYIDAVANAGADAVKFQTHIADAESTPEEPWRVDFSPQDDTRYEYWERMEFTESQWRGLEEHAREAGLLFLSSPFSVEAVDLLEDVGVPAWKIASGEVNNLPMLERIAGTGKPVILSSGMSGWDEIDRAVERVRDEGLPVAVLQCTSTYPCPPEEIGLNLLSEIEDRYGCPTGLSDHSGTIYAGLAAAAHGADIVEVHVTMSREMFGPDVPASITTDELAELVDGTEFVHQAIQNPVDKDEVAEKMEDLRSTFTKSLVTSADLPAGTTLQEKHLDAKKPGTGISADRIDEVVGARLSRDVPENTILTAEALDGDPDDS